MNYLAHIHLATITNTSKTGSLLGDFVKGQVSELSFNTDIKQGIQLHRAVDTFTDSHPYTKSLTRQLGSLRRYGGIIVDVLYDHQLALKFQQFHHQPLNHFAQKCYLELDGDLELDKDIEHLPEAYIAVVNAMKEMDWLSSYHDINNIKRALIGISRRLKKPVNLTECLAWYLDNQDDIEQNFPQFYTDLINFANKQVSNSKS
jgi:acyl carrier protein phosphodiesterase